jgi:hypothetical protein
MKRFKTQKAYLVLMFIISVFSILPGCGGGEAGGGTWNKAPFITAYTLNGVAGTINEPKQTIAVTMPYGTDLTALVATYTTTGTVVSVGSVAQTSGSTANNFTGPVVYTVTVADSPTSRYTVNVTVAPNFAKAITAYSFVEFPGSPGVINEPAKTIAVTLPFGASITALTANFTTTGTSVTVGALVQMSGTTANNFTGQVTYTVIAEDGTSVTYAVNVTIASITANAITAYSFVGFPGFAGTINEPAKTIAVNLPFGAPLTTLIANFTTTGVGVTIGAVAQTSGTTANNFTAPLTYSVTAADGITTATYTVTVTVALNNSKAITAYSFVGFPGSPGAINEAAKTIAVNLPFGTDVRSLIATFAITGTGVKIGAAAQTSSSTQNNFTAPQTYRVTAADASFADYVVTVTVTPPILSSVKTITAYSFVGYPGSPGAINEAAKTIAVVLPTGTDVTALTANFTTVAPSVKIGVNVQTSGGAPTNNFTAPQTQTYRVTAADLSFVDYVVTVTVTPPVLSSVKTITAYSFVGFPGSPGAINEAAKTIAVVLPTGTDVTALTANFTTVAPSVKIGAAVQTSGGAPTNNFTAPQTQTYRVTAADLSFVDYVVTVTVTPPLLSSIKTITAYSFVGFPGSPGTINEAAKTIAVTLPTGTAVTALTANFTTVAPGVKIGAAVQTSGGAPTNNFTAPQTYRVTAADASFVDYVVTVTVTPSSIKTITAYSFVGFPGSPGVVNEAAKTIAVTLPTGTAVTALTANFTTVASSVKIGATVQTSGGAPTNNFTAPQTYRVTAADASFVDYVVTVTIAGNSAKAITAFSFIGFSAYTGTVDEAAKTITVTLPYGTDVTALTAKYATTGTVVKIGSVVQTSEASPTNDFTTPKAYTITAADLSTTLVPYTVTVTIAAANPTAPIFGETARFVILASQKVTTTSGSAISDGDIGIEDQARSYYAGFTAGASPGQFTVLTNGLSYAHDDISPALIPSPYASTIAFINQVRTDLGIAYTFLAADPNPTAVTQVCPIQLGGLTLTKGVYKTASNVGITTGPLHLDAQGDPNAVFIFTTAGALTIGAPSGGIILDNGALAKNVYFRVAGITTIEAGIIAYGNIFSYAQVNMLAGASITGRLFSVNEQVTLISNAVTKAP